MAGVYLNAYPLRFEGEVELWRLPRGEDHDKRARERELGLALWAEREAFWSVHQPADEAASSRRMSAAEPRGRVLFAAREAIVDHAQGPGREAWFGRAGEMSCLGLLPAQDTDRFVLEPQLVMRLVQEPYLDDDAAVVVRARTRWRCAGTLADAELHRRALDEPAIRLSGDGPRRGQVEAVSGDELRVRAGGTSVSVAPDDYALVAGSRLVVAYRGQQVLASFRSRRASSRSPTAATATPSRTASRWPGACCETSTGRSRCPVGGESSSARPSSFRWRIQQHDLRARLAPARAASTLRCRVPFAGGPQAYQGVRAHGPFDSSRVVLGEGTLLFVFPQAMQAQARRLAEAWLRGVGGFPGFEAMFRVPVATGQALKSLPVAADLTDLSAAASAYRDSIGAWSAQQRDADPLLALVLVPHSERWQTDRPYYEAKAAFANLGIPSQMVTTELVAIAECERSADGHAGRASRSPEHAHRVPAAGHRYQRTLSPAPDSQRRRVTELPLDLAAP